MKIKCANDSDESSDSEDLIFKSRETFSGSENSNKINDEDEPICSESPPKDEENTNVSEEEIKEEKDYVSEDLVDPKLKTNDTINNK